MGDEADAMSIDEDCQMGDEFGDDQGEACGWVGRRCWKSGTDFCALECPRRAALTAAGRRT